MYIVYKSEMLHHIECLAKSVGNLCNGRYLPVEGGATNTYRKAMHLGSLTGIHLHMNFITREIEICPAEAEVFYSPHKMQGMWDGKRELVEEHDVKLLEARGGDPMNKCFQVSTNAME
jgi:hypothetical protein